MSAACGPSAVAIEADDGLDGRPADWSVEGLRESLQRLPSREDVDRRLFADGRQCRDRHASIANENRSVLPGCSHPCAGTPVHAHALARFACLIRPRVTILRHWEHEDFFLNSLRMSPGPDMSARLVPGCDRSGAHETRATAVARHR
ncbi:MAG: hypothetical protein DMF90_17635 [Acidobacteria bacterium]|nr:MAG: hypothetical protein DMF90_17635 [Acidobacteriota bacterium]